MFLVGGTKARQNVVGSGEFACPSENAIRLYRHVRVKRAATVFFVPVANIKNLGEYIECQSCGATFNAEVLGDQGISSASSLEQLAQMADRDKANTLTRALQRLAAAAVSVDGKVDEAERQRVFELLNDDYEVPYDEDQFEVDVAAGEGEDLLELLRRAGNYLNGEGKAVLLAAAVTLSMVDEELSEEELALIRAAGRSLDVPIDHVNSLIDHAAGSLAKLTDSSDSEVAERNELNLLRAKESRAKSHLEWKQWEEQLPPKPLSQRLHSGWMFLAGVILLFFPYPALIALGFALMLIAMWTWVLWWIAVFTAIRERIPAVLGGTAGSRKQPGDVTSGRIPAQAQGKRSRTSPEDQQGGSTAKAAVIQGAKSAGGVVARAGASGSRRLVRSIRRRRSKRDE